jgi:hypothetical protein
VAGAEVLVLDEAVGDEFVGDLESPLAEARVDQPPHHGLRRMASSRFISSECHCI